MTSAFILIVHNHEKGIQNLTQCAKPCNSSKKDYLYYVMLLVSQNAYVNILNGKICQSSLTLYQNPMDGHCIDRDRDNVKQLCGDNILF